jgi:nitroreductase
MSIEMVEEEAFNSGTMIKVIGVGGGGGNAVEHMINTHVQGVEFICANTDAQALRRSAAHKVIQLGQSGLGAGSRPERGRDAAMAAENLLLMIEERRWGALLFGLFGDPRVVLDAYAVPSSVSCVGAIAVGYRHPDDQPSGSPTTRTRRPESEVVHVGQW